MCNRMILIWRLFVQNPSFSLDKVASIPITEFKLRYVFLFNDIVLFTQVNIKLGSYWDISKVIHVRRWRKRRTKSEEGACWGPWQKLPRKDSKRSRTPFWC